ncbi:MAG: MoaD/ThiS family protein [Dehalococcoidia bacterium]|nr:MoaD/ThiS family protein [Dehalococcoidia bacterium]MDW8119471.1 MoaD/ThiS family protein [Chloroflexota bacterium]
MKVIIRNPRRRELEVHGRRRVVDLLKELGLNPESHVVIRGEDLLTSDEWLQDTDTVEIVSAISGGQQ